MNLGKVQDAEFLEESDKFHYFFFSFVNSRCVCQIKNYHRLSLFLDQLLGIVYVGKL